MKVAVIGAGWAGLAAAVRATQAGHAATLFDMAPRPGGRARSDDESPTALDNGQHILVGGYGRVLALMRDVGVQTGDALLRLPFAVCWPDGTGIALRGRGPRPVDALAALLRARGLDTSDKLALVRSALAWRRAGFDCDASLTAAVLLDRTATARLRERLLDPLCVAALNTPVDEASARVFLAVLRDSLFGDRGASDLLIPRVPLERLLPGPALTWLAANGAEVRLRERVMAVQAASGGWRLLTRDISPVVDADTPATGAEGVFDVVIMATPAPEAARLCASIAPAWSATAGALAHEPIATLWLETPPRHWLAPMLALRSDSERRPAQFAFKLPPDTREPDAHPGGTSKGSDADRVTLVVSAAGPWVARGMAQLRDAGVAQAREALGFGPGDRVECVQARIDRRATFRCVAGTSRPPARVVDGLVAAGDYIDGPYPATLEAAVRSGEAAVAALAAGRAMQ